MWRYENNQLDHQSLLVSESIFTLGNGNLGVRGIFEEGYAPGMESIRGTYVNGFYDEVPIEYPENAVGFPKVLQKQPNLMDAQWIVIELDGERVSLFKNRHSNYHRILHFDRGLISRRFSYQTSHGRTAEILILKMVSQMEKGSILWQVNVDYPGDIHIISSLLTTAVSFGDENDPRVSSKEHKMLEVKSAEQEEKLDWCCAETRGSKLEVCVVVRHEHSENLEESAEKRDEAYIRHFRGSGKSSLTKSAVYKESRSVSDPLAAAKRVMDESCRYSFSEHEARQKHFFDDFWNRADIQVWGDQETQLAIRLHLFQLLQSIGRSAFQNISAKGLSGEGYEGHYFWDTEIYVLPLFQLISPETAKNLLLNRYGMLEESRKRARELGHKKGVKFPWRTITGKECSAYFPAGTAQYHINGDIAYGFIQHYFHTRDEDFLLRYGLEVLLETSRCWLDLGHYAHHQFCIDAVTGPDEYTAIVNNNYYTNAMAKFGLSWTVSFWRMLKEKYPIETAAFAARMSLCEKEITEMERAAANMYLPHHEALGIDKQDDQFLDKKIWDFEGTAEDQYPLLLNFHPLTIYRHQVLKQADTVLAHYLLEDYSDPETIHKSFDYYEKITTHDSSLSSCVYGMMASKVGYPEKAYQYFLDSVMIDLHNTHRNTKDGLHMANLAGSVLSVITGFAGYRSKEDGIHLHPRKPKEWNGYQFKIQYCQRVVEVTVKDSIEIVLVSGEPLKIWVNDKPVYLDENKIIPLSEN
jgi:alpha,alpha-trehalose phosphorylase